MLHRYNNVEMLDMLWARLTKSDSDGSSKHGDSDSDWSEVDSHELQNIVVPPVSLNTEEIWSD